MWNAAPAYPTSLVLLLTALGIVLCLFGLAALLDLIREWRRTAASHGRLQLWAVVTPDRHRIAPDTVRARREDAEAFLTRPPFDEPGYHVEPVSVSLGPPSRRRRARGGGAASGV